MIAVLESLWVVLVSLFALGILLVVALNVLAIRYLRYAKYCQKEEYRKMGEPKLFRFGHPEETWKFLRYFWKRQYLSTGNESFIARSKVVRKCLMTYFLVLLSIFVVHGVIVVLALLRG